jgi:hypothetical protein
MDAVAEEAALAFRLNAEAGWLFRTSTRPTLNILIHLNACA